MKFGDRLRPDFGIQHRQSAVSNFGRQTPPEDIGVDAFEFWCPKRRPEGKNIALEFSAPLTCFGAKNLLTATSGPTYSPTAGSRPPDDRTPSVRIDLGEERTVRPNQAVLRHRFRPRTGERANGAFRFGDAPVHPQLPHYRRRREPPVPHGRQPQSCSTIGIGRPRTHAARYAFWPEDSAPGRHKALMGIIVE